MAEAVSHSRACAVEGPTATTTATSREKTSRKHSQGTPRHYQIPDSYAMESISHFGGRANQGSITTASATF